MSELNLTIKMPKVEIKQSYWHKLWFLFGDRLENKTCAKIYVNGEMIKRFTYKDLKNEKESINGTYVIDAENDYVNEFLESDYFSQKLGLI